MKKKCRKCNKIKKLELYYTHPRMADGHLNFCKCCVKERVCRYGKTKKVRTYDKLREQTPHRKAWKIKYQRIMRARYKIRYKARQKVSNAIRAGRIIKKACAECGNKNSQAHHPDYYKPLDIVWLCRKHHRLKHKA